MSTNPGSAAPGPRVRGTRRRSRSGQVVLASLVVVTMVLGAVTVWVGATVANGDPDDVAPVLDSLAFQRASLEGGSADAAQGLFPEGSFFSYVLYGLTWTDLAAAGHVEPATARTEAAWALAHLESEAGTGAFDESLSPRYGIFYAGWTLLLRAQAAAPWAGPLAAGERERVQAEADAVAAAFRTRLDAGASPFLAAYPNQTWPVDNVVAIAALRRADAATGDDHDALIDRWLERSSALVDPRTELLPHRTDPRTGEALEGARGTSQSIIQRVWPIVDPATAPEMYARFGRHFVTSAAGFVGIREYPEGVDGSGDVDSGPLVLGFSASSTAVAIGAARANGDPALAATILHEADVFGLPLTVGGERRYALGLLPIGDAFVSWSRAAPTGPVVDGAVPTTTATWPLHLLIPWAVVGIGWLLVARRSRRPGAAGPLRPRST